MLADLVAAALLPLCALAGVVGPRQAANRITVNLDKKYQTIDGFGFSEAFQRAYNIMNRRSSFTQPSIAGVCCLGGGEAARLAE